MSYAISWAASESPASVLILKDVAAGLQSIATAIALMAGGIWAYYKFFRSRTFHPRLEGAIEANVVKRSQYPMLQVEINLKNGGLTSLFIVQHGSGLRILRCSDNDSGDLYDDVPWEHLSTRSVFESHEWIEPSESISEKILLQLGPEAAVAYKLDLRLVAGTNVSKAPAHRFTSIVIPKDDAPKLKNQRESSMRNPRLLRGTSRGRWF
jgi:hypothetical protein